MRNIPHSLHTHCYWSYWFGITGIELGQLQEEFWAAEALDETEGRVLCTAAAGENRREAELGLTRQIAVLELWRRRQLCAAAAGAGTCRSTGAAGVPCRQ